MSCTTAFVFYFTSIDVCITDWSLSAIGHPLYERQLVITAATRTREPKGTACIGRVWQQVGDQICRPLFITNHRTLKFCSKDHPHDQQKT